MLQAHTTESVGSVRTFKVYGVVACEGDGQVVYVRVYDDLTRYLHQRIPQNILSHALSGGDIEGLSRFAVECVNDETHCR